MSDINIVNGRIIHKETGFGVPNITVEVLNTVSKQSGSGKNSPRKSTSSRIGAVITDENGYFELIYKDEIIQKRQPDSTQTPPSGNVNKRDLSDSVGRPNLMLVVLAPEEADLQEADRTIYKSPKPRDQSGKEESFLIRITSSQLEKAKIPIPGSEDEPKSVDQKIESFKEQKIEQNKFRQGIKSFLKDRDAAKKAEKETLKALVEKAILPNAEALDSMYNFVSRTDKVKDVQQQVFHSGLAEIESSIASENADPEPGQGIKIHLYLTEEEKNGLDPFVFTFDGKPYYNIPKNKIQELLFKREEDGGIDTILFANNPITKSCLVKSTQEKCAAKYVEDDIDATEPDEQVPKTEVSAMQKEDIPQLLAQALHGGRLGEMVAKRPDANTIQRNVDTFALEKGPADATAFYDFHSLQIAFQHVWQQLLDETIINLSERVHDNLENAGKKGFVSILKDKEDIEAPSLQMMVNSLEAAQSQLVSEVPTDIMAAFDISFVEYDALSIENKDSLLAIAKDINARELILSERVPYNAGGQADHRETSSSVSRKGISTRKILVDNATYVALLRERGERIIDNIRINKPFSTNQLLKELQERLLSTYEFTVFAANKDYHSINFGLMNTYRQRWEPISYQAGQLVKTLPLSPKEERKYSVKTVRKVKNTIKQAQKNNSSISGETTATSRAESDIIAKANASSNFNMNVDVDTSRVKTGVKFGKDAAKESSETKKEFRESVIKASQEYKEERSLQIDTEESFDSEYSESGTITNPNDELSVTYLFYELQRRYRISEQLYRVMPVVMVAQEVPSPDQITEAWIIAHDWILNRVLLDDSFRPTLQYISSRNVGDDFAIRELRKNLRQQRSLVNHLKVEFSKLKIDVQDKYAAFQESTEERIEEEHDQRFYKKRLFWWGHYYRNQDTPPDPEMAKAIEQAAEDDYQHTVDQAKEMALSVQREVNTLHRLTSAYNKAMQEYLDQMTESRRLITHIKENILYYMQEIWRMEPPDQRYMRLFNVEIPYFEIDRTCVVSGEASEDVFAQFREDGKQKYQAWIHGKVRRRSNGTPEVSYKPLVEVADLDTLLGFKGNYMIFPLNEHNALTELMAAPFIDEAFGAMDPDEWSNINLEEYAKYVCCLHDEAPEEYERLKPVLKKWLERLLSDPLRNGDEIIVPTNSLFIEMLPSDMSLLEDFKLEHRKWDVKKVKEEVAEMRLENIRMAARLLEGDLEDPDVDKKIVVEGNGLSSQLNVE